MSPAARTGPPVRTLAARLALLAGLVLLALLMALGGSPFRLGRTRDIATIGGQGYWLLAKDGGLFAYGDATYLGNNLNSGSDIVGMAPTPTLKGYWTADDDGTVFHYGDAHDYGSRVSSVNDIRGFAGRPQGDGYWLVTRDGVVTAKGSAVHYGNAPALATNQKIVGMASTPSGNGYWLVGRDGGVFAFGDAGFYGSTGATVLNQPIVGIAGTPSGHGYWFVASDGGVFAFGDAPFDGSTGANPPASGVSGIAATSSGHGYWLVAGNGKVYPFGDAISYGDPSNVPLSQPVIGIAATPVVHQNQVPAAAADSASVAEDGSVTVNVLGNDTGLGDTPISVSVVSGPAHGTASVTAEGHIAYSPAANYHGSDSLGYKVTDADGESSTAAVSLTVTSVNDAPLVSNVSTGTDEDTAHSGTLSGSDVDGDSLVYSVVSVPSKGSVVLNPATGAYTYTPNADVNGTDSFTFRANDGTANSNTGTVSITIAAVNDAPVANAAEVTVAEDATLNGSASATDVDSANLTYTLVDGPAHADSFTFNPDGTFVYTPAADYNGSDGFTFKASDGQLDSDVATVSIDVTAVNDAPVVVGDSQTTDEDTALQGTLSGSDIDGDTLTYAVSTSPSHGAVSLDGAGYTYTPAANYNGDDSFAFTANDGTVDSAPATISIHVNSVEDVPVFTQTGNSFIDVSTTGTDIGNHGDDDDTTVALPFPVSFYGNTYSGNVVVSANGWLSFDGQSYGYSNYDLSEVGGPVVAPFWDDLWTYGDGLGIFTDVRGSAPHRQYIVQWNVTHYGSGGATVSFEAVFTEGSPVVDLRYGNVLFGTSEDAGASATVGVANGGSNFSQFSIDTPSLSNGMSLSFDTSTNVETTGSGQIATNEDSPVQFDVPATDGDGDPLTYAISADPTHGEAVIDPATGHVTYTPATNFNGADTFTVSVTDGHSAPVTKDVTVAVTPVNDAPVIAETSPLTLSVDEDSVLGQSVTATASDVDGDTLTWSASDPDHGTVTGGGSTGDFTYVPDANFDGSESFTITVDDGHGGTATIPVDVTMVNLNNDPPTASPIGDQVTDEDVPLQIPFTVSDPDTGDVLTVTVGSSDPTLLPDGSLTLSGTGNDRILTVTPAANLSGQAHLFLMVSDGQAAPVLEDILLTVNPVNDLPVANDGSLTTAEDTAGTGTLAGDDPVEHSPVTFSLVGDNGGAVHGTVTIDDANTGAYTYQPEANYNGPDSFTFVANDGSDNSAPATVSIDVTAVNDAPVANADSLTLNEDTTGSGTLTGSDPVEGSPVTFALDGNNGGGAHGTVTITDDHTGAYTYQPDPNYAGPDSFAFVTNDGTDTSAPATISIMVDNVNDVPVVSTIGDQATNEDTPLAIPFTVSDADPGDTVTVTVGSSNPTLLPAGALTLGQSGINWTLNINPAANLSGTADVFVSVSDGHAAPVIQHVLLTVNPVNDLPVANAGTLTTAEDTPGTGTLTGSDPVEGSPVHFVLGTDAGHGHVVITDPATGAYTYTPTADYNGGDSFTFVANDGTDNSAPATVTVTVTPVNDPPVANAGLLTTAQDTPDSGTLTGSDPVEGSPVTYSLVGPNGGALHGTVVITNPATGAYDYTPDAGYTGGDSFSFVANDGTDNSAPATITVTVDSLPVIDGAQSDVSVNAVFDTVAAWDASGHIAASDPDNGDTLQYSIENNINGAEINVTPNVNGGADFTYFVFAPAEGPGFAPDAFTVKVTDSHGLTTTIQVTVQFPIP